MKIVICTSFWNETLSLEVANLAQVVNYLEENLPEIYAKLQDIKCIWVLGDSSQTLEPVALNPAVAGTDFIGYDLLVVGEPIEGEALFSSLTAALAVSIAAATGATMATATLVATIIVNVAVMIGMAVLMYGIRSLMSMMSPSSSFTGDGATQRKNLMLNGIPNIDEQGGAIPVVVGECFFGAIKAGQNVTTRDINVSGNDADLDKTIPEIPMTSVKNVGNGHWYRIQ